MSVVPFIQELIVCDTGSQDRSPEIAKEIGSQAPYFLYKELLWKNDFSAARNEAATWATQDWILFVDGDEVLDAQASSLFEKTLKSTSAHCFSLIQRNYSRDSRLENSIKRSPPFPGLNEFEELFSVDNWMERLYRNRCGIEYSGVIHESLIPSCQRLGFRTEQVPIILHHYGRLKPTQNEKLSYYLKLTQQKYSENPQDPAAAMELAITLSELGRHVEALQVIRNILNFVKEEPELIKVGFQVALRAEDFHQADLWIQNYLLKRPNDLYALSQWTTSLLYQRKWKEMFEVAEKIFQMNPHDFVAHLNLAVVHFENQNWKDALRHLQVAHHQRPNDLFVMEAIKKVEAALQNH